MFKSPKPYSLPPVIKLPSCYILRSLSKVKYSYSLLHVLASYEIIVNFAHSVVSVIFFVKISFVKIFCIDWLDKKRANKQAYPLVN